MLVVMRVEAHDAFWHRWFMRDRLRVLVADDHADCGEAIGTVLRLLGHDVRIVRNGCDALELVDSFEPELMLLDLCLPDVTGLDIAHAVRMSDGSQPYLVALTGWAEARYRDLALDAGFDRFVIKPPELDTLRELVTAAQDARRIVAATAS